MPSFGRAAAALLALCHGLQDVSGCSCISLFQTSVQIQKPMNAEERKARRRERRAARIFRAKLTPNTGAVEAKIDQANATLSTVTELLFQVNTSSAEFFGQIDASLTAALQALETAKTSSAMIGPDMSKTMTEIADKMTAAATKLQVTLQKASTQVESQIEKLTAQLTTLAGKVLANLKSAVDKVNGADSEPQEAEPEAALLGRLRSAQQGPFDWLLGGSNKFQKARDAITQANNSVAQLDSMLDSINTTAVSLLMETTLGEVTSGLESIEMLASVTNIPGQVAVPLTSVLSNLDGVLSKATSTITSTVNAIEPWIESARGSLPMLYAASDSLTDMVDSAEEASKNA